MEIEHLIELSYSNARDKGFWDPQLVDKLPCPVMEKLMLIVTEDA